MDRNCVGQRMFASDRSLMNRASITITSALSDDHPLVQKLSELFGDHTFFLDSSGVNIVEPNESADASPPVGTVVNVANWSDSELTSLAPHAPEPTEVVVM